MTNSPGRIRDFNPNDRRALVEMLVESEPWITLGYERTDWDQLFDSFPTGREGYVMESDGVASGLAVLRPRVLLGDYLELLAVAPAKRGKGMGTALLKYVERIVFGRTKNLFVCVSDFNGDARRFYEQHGYQLVGPMPDLLVSGHAELLMRKTVGPVRK